MAPARQLGRPAARRPAWSTGRPAAPPTHTTRPRGRRLRPAPLFRSRPSAPPPLGPPRPPRPDAPPSHLRAPRRSGPCAASPRHPPWRAMPPPVAIPRGGPVPSPVPEDVSEKGILRDRLFRNVLCEGAGLFPFQKRPLRGCRTRLSEAPSVTLATIWARPCLTCRAGISHCDLWAYRRWRLAKPPALQIRPVPSPPLPRLLCGLPARHPPARPYRAPRRWPA